MPLQVVTISRICVLMWFTIFFETVSLITPSTFTEAATLPYATGNTTENVTDFTATTISNNTTENVTEVPATTIWRKTTELVTSIITITVTPVPTSPPSNDTNPDIEKIILYIVIGGLVLVIIFYYLTSWCCKSENFSEKTLSPWAIVSLPSPKFSTTGPISRVELWKMMEYATDCHERDKLSEVISSLMKDGTNGSIRNTPRVAQSTEESYYQQLVVWKGEYNGATLMEIYRIGFEAGMSKTVKKLQDFRGTVSKILPLTSTDLEHVLWQIGNKSRGNISHLLHTLGVNPPVKRRASLKEMVNEARDRLQIWQEGYVPINPVIMLSLALEEFQISPLEEEFFQVPENQKKPLQEAEKRQYICDATIRHCKRILKVFRSERRDDIIVISKTLDENNKTLFDTYRMVEDWLEEQETSNYEKRRALDDAIKSVEISEPDAAGLFNATVIREEVSKSGKHGKVKAAWKLLRTDIQPFAKALGVDESKLTDYKPPFQDSHLKMGTVGLVSKLVD